MKTIAILLAALVLQACDDITQVPEEHRAAADSLVRADSIAAFPATQIHTWKVCIAGEDKSSAQEWEDARFWGSLKVRLGADTIKTPDMHTGECWSLGERVDTVHMRILSTATATRFDSVWVQMDTLPTHFYAGWRQVLLRADSVQVLSDSVYLDGSRGMNKARRGAVR